MSLKTLAEKYFFVEFVYRFWWIVLLMLGVCTAIVLFGWEHYEACRATGKSVLYCAVHTHILIRLLFM